jgi:surface protein
MLLMYTPEYKHKFLFPAQVKSVLKEKPELFAAIMKPIIDLWERGRKEELPSRRSPQKHELPSHPSTRNESSSGDSCRQLPLLCSPRSPRSPIIDTEEEVCTVYDPRWDKISFAPQFCVFNQLFTEDEQREMQLRRVVREMPRDNEREFRFTMVGRTVSIPFEGTYAIDWGDGQVELERKRGANYRHSYGDMKPSHQIKIFSFHPEFYRGFHRSFPRGLDADAVSFETGLISIEQWGQLPLQRAMFMDCKSLEKITDPLPPFQLRGLSRHGAPAFVAEYANAPGATDLSALFKNCSSLRTINGFSSWDMSRVTHAEEMLQGSAIDIHINLEKLDNVVLIREWSELEKCQPGIRKLEYNGNERIYNHLPDSVTHLTFGRQFNQPIAVDVLPLGLTHLTFGADFNQPIGENVLPKTLTHLTFGYWSKFNKPIGQNVLPQTLTHLMFGLPFRRGLVYNGSLFNQSIEENVLPDGLKHLGFNGYFNKELKENVLPAGLTHLTFGVAFNQPLHPNVLPEGLTHLTFDEFSMFDQDIPVGALPDSLKHLTFGGKYDLTIAKDVLPKELTHLTLNVWHSLKDILPKKLTHLAFVRKGWFDEPIEPGDLPETLTHLTLTGYFDEPLGKDVLPPSLTHLTFGECSRFKRTITLDAVLQQKFRDSQLIISHPRGEEFVLSLVVPE